MSPEAPCSRRAAMRTRPSLLLRWRCGWPITWVVGFLDKDEGGSLHDGSARAAANETSLSAAVAGVLSGLQGVDRFERAFEDVGHWPALEAGIGVDLRAMMDLVLEHHHEHAPAGERPGSVDHLDPAGEPRIRCVPEQRDEALGGGLQPGQPRPLVVAIHLGLRGDPALAPVGAGEVEARPTDVTHDVADAPAGLATGRWRPPRGGFFRERRDVAFGPSAQGAEEAGLGGAVGDHGGPPRARSASPG